MNGLHSNFGERVDFINLNIENPDHNVTRANFGLSGRSVYKLISPDGEVLRTWAGPLDLATVSGEMEQLIAELGF